MTRDVVSPQRLRIAYLTMQFPVPSETFATTDVRELRRLGHHVAVFTLRPPHVRHRSLLEERELADLPVDSGGLQASLRGVGPLLRRPRLATVAAGEAWAQTPPSGQRLRAFALLPRAFDVFERLVAWRPHVVHAFWGHYPVLALRLVQQRLPGIVTSLSLGAYDLLARFGPARSAARSAAWIRTHAEVNRAPVAEFLEKDPDEIEVVHDGIDRQRVRSLADGQARVPGRVVSAGRLIGPKGMSDVLDAFEVLASRWPKATLTVLGDGPERAALERRAASMHASDRVRFLGHVPHDRVIEEMARGEVMTLMTRHAAERLPNVLKEAMACGCIPVTTPSPGIEELVESGTHGYVVHDVRGAVDAVDEIWRQRERLEALRSAATERVSRDFDVRATVPSYVRAWNGALHAMPRAASARPPKASVDARGPQAGRS